MINRVFAVCVWRLFIREVIQQVQVKVVKVYGVVHLVMYFILMLRMIAEVFLRWPIKEPILTGID